ncbi:MAG: hypothetical protein B6I28_04835 [Fusobacteriia bacterium 4572_132]|nr:MAG: hypothetical protein B6I28_04835 [Fusobacteriia bacterium 4572_132]
MKILVIEDDLVTRKVIQRTLEKMDDLDDIKVDVAEDGIIGFDKFKKALENEAGYKIICLDIMMPQMNGQEVLHEIRKLENEKSNEKPSKIIMMTALSDIDNIKKAYSEECDEYLVKPIKKEELKRVILKSID